MNIEFLEKFNKYKKTLKSINHYIYALCEISEKERKIFYVGKGVKTRCLEHLTEEGNSEKNKKIRKLLEEERLGIDILRHGIKDDATAKLIEATCIDLLGIGELTNKVRGMGTKMGRMSIEEINYIHTGDEVTVSNEHKGLAFLLNSTYKSGMSELELFEVTRGVWHNVPRDKEIKYAYATYAGVVKEVYEIHSWVKSGTQQYFTRTIDKYNRWEFIGKIADSSVRDKYVGKLIKKDRSHGSPFVKVGF